MDREKLQKLRARYAERDAFDGDDPVLTRAASEVRSPEGRRSLPYSGVATFLGLPQATDLAGLDIAVVGVPMDLGVSNRAGARLGPRAVRGVERIGPYHPTLKGVPKARARAADVGDVPFNSRYSLEQSLADIEQYYLTLKARGIRPLSVGGDHSITYPILKALGREAPLALVHIDAHCDTMGAYDGSKFHHGGPFRLAVLDGALDPERTIQIGIRGAANMFWEFSHASGMTVIYMEDFLRMGLDAVIAKAREVVGGQPVYVSVDVDGFDPAYAPGTGTPEAGGLEAREGLALLRGLAGLNVVGADVVEVAPQYDPTSNTAQLAAQILFEEFALMTLGRE
ncbi:MAG: agmatinase [Gammaproteobacteria bacterium]|nr:agmatinase [Gammaproteobacteria bacterium]MBV9698189.1 agmatinase [Gammaproteobacteria bacterium]